MLRKTISRRALQPRLALPASTFIAARRSRRHCSTESDNKYEYIQDKLLDTLEKPEGVMVDGTWNGSPVPPLWDRCDIPLGGIKFKDPTRGFRARVHHSAVASSLKPKYNHYAEILRPDFPDKFAVAYEDVVESFNSEDYDHLESIFGNCLKRKLRGWRSRWEREGLKLKINSTPKVIRAESLVSLTQGDMSEADGDGITLSNFDGKDTDFLLKGVPGVLRIFTKLPSFFDRFPSARIIKYSPCYGVHFTGSDLTFSIAEWVSFYVEHVSSL
eukprot:TRINITY_DN7183_c0_g1_i1.p1 TRINITY_DN7183_c0_g1~~TRINITY_DN7183_c0_g1_i1.p1  ORF type:complete len:272 (+),score=29.64 TRINITY_DN7183_c0_g1_i1:29-844(+)